MVKLTLDIRTETETVSGHLEGEAGGMFFVTLKARFQQEKMAFFTP